MVEAAFILPVLFTLLFGLMDGALLMRSALTLGNAVRAGVRVAGVKGSDFDVDYQVLQTIKSESRAMDPNSILRIVVFKANPPTGSNVPQAVPDYCKTMAAPGTFSDTNVTPNVFCNVYAPARDFAATRTANDYLCVTGTGKNDWAKGWCPSQRFSQLTRPGVTPALAPDYVGIYIVVQHQLVTGLFGRTKILTQSDFVRIEAKRYTT